MDRAPDEDPPRRSSWRRRAPLAAIVALLLTGGLLLVLGTTRQQPAPPPAVAKGPPPTAAPHSSTPSTEPRTPPLPSSRPVSITIPSLKVTSDLEQLGLGKNRAMETPKDPAKAGWYRPGTTPGAIGPSVIAGHVTWDGVPAVFFKLTELEPGDRIDVSRADGTTAVFTVDRTATYPKDDFPTVEVYRNLDHAGLRLITCGGDYSREDSRYADNVVVYASLTGHGGR
ncbi:class F sortase [Streptomyces sp. YIM 132580]|uniref:class F sortase n=1 Tax=Streptomyces sp. YIM 132580 TaxID=2691958 RepID=UPI001371CBD9|nr:class F sortase [Streptomyces sp. YIM 132580]MXG25295.1 class F sortase [Streptomyces sp. YIM 132580]